MRHFSRIGAALCRTVLHVRRKHRTRRETRHEEHAETLFGRGKHEFSPSRQQLRGRVFCRVGVETCGCRVHSVLFRRVTRENTRARSAISTTLRLLEHAKTRAVRNNADARVAKNEPDASRSNTCETRAKSGTVRKARTHLRVRMGATRAQSIVIGPHCSVFVRILRNCARVRARCAERRLATSLALVPHTHCRRIGVLLAMEALLQTQPAPSDRPK